MTKNAFPKAKQIFYKSLVIELYDFNKDVVWNCDAFEYGIVCAISHIVESNVKPIAYASRTMNKSEKNMQ